MKSFTYTLCWGLTEQGDRHRVFFGIRRRRTGPRPTECVSAGGRGSQSGLPTHHPVGPQRGGQQHTHTVSRTESYWNGILKQTKVKILMVCKYFKYTCTYDTLICILSGLCWQGALFIIT